MKQSLAFGNFVSMWNFHIVEIAHLYIGKCEHPSRRRPETHTFESILEDQLYFKPFNPFSSIFTHLILSSPKSARGHSHSQVMSLNFPAQAAAAWDGDDGNGDGDNGDDGDDGDDDNGDDGNGDDDNGDDDNGDGDNGDDGDHLRCTLAAALYVFLKNKLTKSLPRFFSSQERLHLENYIRDEVVNVKLFW